MNEPSTVELTVPAGSDRLTSAIRGLTQAIDHTLSSGDVSQLRRLSPEDPGCPAFWKLVATHLQPTGEIPLGDGAEKVEKQWAGLLAGMAQMRGLHLPGNHPGKALAKAGYSELRFERLLRAKGTSLLDAVREVARFLSSKGEPVDWLQLARLVKFQEGEGGGKIRRSLARDFYGALDQLQNTEGKND